jgi:AAA15 family ATPase/GTPase
MLVAFKLQNFRSFLTEQHFTFASTADRSHDSHCLRTNVKAVPRLTKSAIFFGANASGKTNLLIALATFRYLILHSTSYSDDALASWYTPFRFGPSANAPTCFEIEVLLEGVRYRYSAAYDSRRIRSESLLVYRTGKSQRWFERSFDTTAQREEWAPFSPNFNGPREMWRRATRPQALFLTAAAQLNSEQLAPLVHWIEHGLEILFPADHGDMSRIAAYIGDTAFKDRLLTLLRAVDIAVEDVRVAEPESAAKGAAQEHFAGDSASPVVEFLYARPGSPPVWLDSMFESAGTHRLFCLFGPLLAAIERGKLLLIDEFDTGLHPLIARFLVQLINDPQVSTQGAQLVLVSHNATLMDLDILRRDEIWLVQLDAGRTSTLLPLMRASPRKRELIARNYLKGMYGAVPRIEPELRELRDGEPRNLRILQSFAK